MESRFKGNPLIIIDGIEIDTKNIDIAKYQDTAKYQQEYMEEDLAMKHYGEKGKNGAIIITTKQE
jgi:hypothetical protein